MSFETHQDGIKSYSVSKYTLSDFNHFNDQIAIEAPLLISLTYPGVEAEELVITMQTPVHSEDLIIGFLYSEGIIDTISQILKMEIVDQEAKVTLSQAPIKQSKRGTVSTAACGMCGKTSLEAVSLVRTFDLTVCNIAMNPSLLLQMNQQMRKAQTLFEHTGGIHAAALFDAAGQIVLLREDIGRHNAVDKAIGQMLVRGIDRKEVILFVSGRAGFELVQKALVAGIGMMVAVGAPSSLAVDYAADNNMTLIGFMQKGKFNVYTHPYRVIGTSIKKT
jgi:FdhD protein